MLSQMIRSCCYAQVSLREYRHPPQSLSGADRALSKVGAEEALHRTPALRLSELLERIIQLCSDTLALQLAREQ